MKKAFLGLLVACLCWGETGLSANNLQNADLVFVGAENSAFSQAIKSATAKDGTDYTHIGMVEVAQDGVFVIEATAEKGVVRTAWVEFMRANKGRAMSLMRLKKSIKFNANTIIARAKGYLGQPYDWAFLPDNDKMYCSELVWEAFVDEKGKRIFTANPMNFYDEKGNLPEFWVQNFKKLGISVPQGVLGTNPNDMSKSPQIERVENKRVKD